MHDRSPTSLLCGVGMLMGWGGWVMPDVHLPTLGEAGPLLAVTLGFVAAGVWLFRRFGDKRSATSDLDVELAEVVAEMEEAADTDPAAEGTGHTAPEHEPIGV